MFKIGIAFLTLATFIGFSSSTASAQIGVGIQAPLAAFGSFKMEFASLEIGMPFRTDLTALEAYASAKLFLGTWEFQETTIQPYVGGSGKVAFSDLSVFKWIGLVGVEANIPESNFAVFTHLGIAPDFHTGLLESMAVGMRYSF